jgi:hypothetical protein
MGVPPFRKGGQGDFSVEAGLVPALKGNHKGRPYNPIENPSCMLALWRVICNAIELSWCL